MMATSKATSSRSSYASPNLAALFNVDNGNAKRRRRRRMAPGGIRTPNAPLPSPTSTLQEEERANSKAMAKAADPMYDEAHKTQHLHNTQHTACISQQPINTSTIKEINMTELKGFKFGFDISTNNNASGRLYDKNDDAFTFEFGVDDATLLMDSPQTTSSVKQQHRISKKSKKKKKKKKKRGKKSTSTINIIQDGGEHETGSAVDATVSVATKNHEAMAGSRIKKSKMDSIDRSGDHCVQNVSHTLPSSQVATHLTAACVATTSKDDEKPSGFQYNPVVKHKTAMVNRQSMQKRNLQQQRGIAQTQAFNERQGGGGDAMSNPFTFGFSIFGDGILPPTPTSGN